jgi:TetR/AcrR family transcriptional repressor of nem operon
MARPKTYSDDAVIDKALAVFWEKGFMGASSRDLIEATGMSNGSLFNRFGDKKQLYLACLQKYDNVYITDLERVLATDMPFKKKLKKVLENAIKKVPNSNTYEGCFFFNTSVDSGIDDKDILLVAARIRKRIEQAFHGAIEQAKKIEQLPIKIDSTEMAKYFSAINTGLRALAKNNTSAGEMSIVINTTLKLLPF